ncbi:alpha/beta fold hydrolase [Litorimonas sp. RW-G-Af-16]|uniref:alpha/beta fold hydrolase n=1 Tax=Litorimonas sp. RW-G-Af-16 TaxID=3241168 RepID=UPI00390C8644
MAVDNLPDFHPNLPRIFFSRVGNQTLRTAIWSGKDKGFGKRTPLLFFNGIGANLEIAQAFADTFTGRDIITFDMPGVGGSPDPTVPYRPWWVAKAAKQILLENGYKKVDVLGVSWGGGPAQQFAWQCKDMTKRLILCATTTGVTMVPGNPKALSKMMSPKRYIDRDFLAKNFETLYGDAAEAGVRDFSINMVPPSVKGYLYQLMAMVGYSTLPFIRRIRAKTLVIMGDNDHIVPVTNGYILNFALKRSKLKIIEGAGHLFLLTRRDETIGIIRDFFGEPEVAEPHVEPVLLPSVAAAFNHKDEFDPAFVKAIV